MWSSCCCLLWNVDHIQIMLSFQADEYNCSNSTPTYWSLERVIVGSYKDKLLNPLLSIMNHDATSSAIAATWNDDRWVESKRHATCKVGVRLLRVESNEAPRVREGMNCGKATRSSPFPVSPTHQNFYAVHSAVLQNDHTLPSDRYVILCNPGEFGTPKSQ